MLRFVIKNVRNVTRILFSEKYLFFTNVGISISLSGVGDMIEQQYEVLTHQKEEWDRVRTRQMSISGMTVGIFCHTWYRILDRRLPGRSIGLVMKKVLIDQLVASPIYMFIFFLTLGYLRKSSIEDIANEIKDKAITLYTAEWVVWPPAQIINFYLLPPRFRVLYDNSISLGYDIYTSQVINSPRKIAS